MGTSFSFHSADRALSGTNRLCRMPQYNAFGDPHLVDYFARKFGVLDEEEPDRRFGPRKRLHRSASHGRGLSTGRRHRRDEEFYDSFSDDDSEQVYRKKKSKTKKKKGDEVDMKTSKCIYKVTLVTGHQPHAGTQANVSVRLMGTDGKMPKFKQLTSEISASGSSQAH